jgi:hypothetical protein
VFQTDVPHQHALAVKRVYWTEVTPHGIEVQSKVVIETPRRMLAEMLVEVDDGASEEDTRAAIQAAALADDWATADEIARRYSLVVCLRCAADVATRPTWRLHHLLRHLRDVDDAPISNADWGEVCGPCAVEMFDLQGKKK